MDKLLFGTVLVQVVLTLVMMVLMGKRRFAAARNREFHLNAFRTMDLAGANEKVITASRNFDNLLQMPVLFFAGVLAVLQQHLFSRLTPGQQPGIAQTGKGFMQVIPGYPGLIQAE